LVQLNITKSGQYIFHQDDEDGNVILEANVGAQPAQVWLSPGQYFVRRRTPEKLYQGPIAVWPGRAATLDSRDFRAIGYAQWARKGGYGGYAWGLSLWGGYGTPVLQDYGGTPLLALGIQLDLADLTLDSRIYATRSTRVLPQISASLDEVGFAVGARKVIDVEFISLSAGIRVGAAYLSQTFDTTRIANDRATLTPILDTLFRTDFQLPAGFFLGVEADARLRYLRGTSSDGQAQTPVQFALQAGLGRAF